MSRAVSCGHAKMSVEGQQSRPDEGPWLDDARHQESRLYRLDTALEIAVRVLRSLQAVGDCEEDRSRKTEAGQRAASLAVEGAELPLPGEQDGGPIRVVKQHVRQSRIPMAFEQG